MAQNAGICTVFCNFSATFCSLGLPFLNENAAVLEDLRSRAQTYL